MDPRLEITNININFSIFIVDLNYFLFYGFNFFLCEALINAAYATNLVALTLKTDFSFVYFFQHKKNSNTIELQKNLSFEGAQTQTEAV